MHLVFGKFLWALICGSETCTAFEVTLILVKSESVSHLANWHAWERLLAKQIARPNQSCINVVVQLIMIMLITNNYSKKIIRQ